MISRGELFHELRILLGNHFSCSNEIMLEIRNTRDELIMRAVNQCATFLNA